MHSLDSLETKHAAAYLKDIYHTHTHTCSDIYAYRQRHTYTQLNRFTNTLITQKRHKNCQNLQMNALFLCCCRFICSCNNNNNTNTDTRTHANAHGQIVYNARTYFFFVVKLLKKFNQKTKLIFLGGGDGCCCAILHCTTVHIQFSYVPLSVNNFRFTCFLRLCFNSVFCFKCAARLVSPFCNATTRVAQKLYFVQTPVSA